MSWPKVSPSTAMARLSPIIVIANPAAAKGLSARTRRTSSTLAVLNVVNPPRKPTPATLRTLVARVRNARTAVFIAHEEPVQVQYGLAPSMSWWSVSGSGWVWVSSRAVATGCQGHDDKCQCKEWSRSSA